MTLTHACQLDIPSIADKLELAEKNKKTIHFYFETIKNGRIGPLVKFPHQGQICAIDAFCTIAADELIEIDIEKISKQDLADDQLWQSIFVEQKLTIEANEDVCHTIAPFDPNVARDDYFRIHFIQPGVQSLVSTLRNLTIQIEIKI